MTNLNMSFDESIAAWQADAPRLAYDYGIHFPDASAYLPADFRRDFKSAQVAMDAQPTLVTASNAGIPWFLSNLLDPKLIEILITPNKFADILGEAKKGDWTTMSAMFPVIERTGEVATYDDWANNGSTGANMIFPQRQSYHYQTMTQWGERQLDWADLAKVDWAAQMNVASAVVLDKFQNNSYAYGIAGLQNYGLLNDPSLPASILPAVKGWGGTKWINNNVIVATPNEIYTDIQSMYLQLTTQTTGILLNDSKIDMDTDLILTMAPATKVALTAANSFGVNVEKLLRENFPNIRIISAPQYALPGGNLIQMIADNVEGQKTGTCAFTEKMRAHAIVRETSAFLQKKSQGTWGCIIFRPVMIASMLGV